jgi:hypothetical protein
VLADTRNTAKLAKSDPTRLVANHRMLARPRAARAFTRA